MPGLAPEAWHVSHATCRRKRIVFDAPRAASAYTEAALPGHLRGDEEDGSTGGEALPGDAPIAAALAELKSPGTTPSATTAAN